MIFVVLFSHFKDVQRTPVPPPVARDLSRNQDKSRQVAAIVCMSVRLYVCCYVYCYFASVSGKRRCWSVQVLLHSSPEFGKCTTKCDLSETLNFNGGFLFISIDHFQMQVIKYRKTPVCKRYRLTVYWKYLFSLNSIVHLKGILRMLRKYCVLVFLCTYML